MGRAGEHSSSEAYPETGGRESPERGNRAAKGRKRCASQPTGLLAMDGCGVSFFASLWYNTKRQLCKNHNGANEWYC